MPELPEVETIARELREGSGRRGPTVVGQTITAVTLRWPRHLADGGPRAFRRRIVGQSIRSVGRRGKYIVFDLSRDTLLIHLRMSGELRVASATEPRSPHDHTCFCLGNGSEMRFNDTRKFGRVHLVADPEEVTGPLGPEPLAPDFTARKLGGMLAARKRALKPLLLDQTFLAGLGNIYTDEALHRARLHPLRRSDSLTPAEVSRLYRGIRAAFRRGIQLNGASLDWVYQGGGMQNEFRVYGREKKPCPRCRTLIQKITLGQRSTHFCPQCQSLPGAKYET